MCKLRWIIFLLSFIGVSFSAMAQYQCGPVNLRSAPQGRFFANGERVGNIIEKTTDENHWTIQFSLMPASDGRSYGFRLVNTGSRIFLNVQLLITYLDAPKFINTYDCKEFHK